MVAEDPQGDEREFEVREDLCLLEERVDKKGIAVMKPIPVSRMSLDMCKARMPRGAWACRSLWATGARTLFHMGVVVGGSGVTGMAGSRTVVHPCHCYSHGMDPGTTGVAISASRPGRRLPQKELQIRGLSMDGNLSALRKRIQVARKAVRAPLAQEQREKARRG